MAHKVENWFLDRSPWQIYLMTFLLGSVGSLSLPPLYIWPALVVMMAGVMILLDCLPEGSFIKRSFILGWWLGFGYFTCGLYWISAALWVDIGRFWWVLPFSLFGLPLLLAFFIAPVVALTAFSRTHGVARVLCFTCLWVLFEWLRGHLFTGFPWNLVGSSWNFSVEMIQLASVVGAYGMSFSALLAALAVPYLFSPVKGYRTFGICVALGVALQWGWGWWRIQHITFEEVPTLWARIVQPSIPQNLKWDPAERENHFRKLMRLTALPSKHHLKIIIWPESAMPFVLEEDTFRRELIASQMPEEAILFTGAVRREIEPDRSIRIWNSVLALSSQAKIVGVYDKAHLVPFGEYFPLRSLLGSLNGVVSKFTPGTIDFTPGEGPETLEIGSLPPLCPLVCYEGIFPGEVVGKTRPAWLLNVTNDGWYGETTGPYQHLESARLRAVEEGAPMVRAANTGVSAVFDSVGREVASLGLYAIGVKDFALPPALKNPTIYSQVRDGLVLILALGGAIFLILWGRKR